MLRQAVFLCLLLAGLAVAQVGKIQIFVLIWVLVVRGNGSEELEMKDVYSGPDFVNWSVNRDSSPVGSYKTLRLKKLVSSNLYEIISLCSRRFFREKTICFPPSLSPSSHTALVSLTQFFYNSARSNNGTVHYAGNQLWTPRNKKLGALKKGRK